METNILRINVVCSVKLNFAVFIAPYGLIATYQRFSKCGQPRGESTVGTLGVGGGEVIVWGTYLF
jgi:hypothetical protein